MSSESPVPAGSRRGIRRSVSLDCELISARGDFPVGCLATDLSTTGIWLATHEPVRAGEHVVVCFEPNDGWLDGELTLFAEVARVITTRKQSAGGGMALEFMDLAGPEQAHLLDWLAKRKMPVPRRRRPLPRILPGVAAHGVAEREVAAREVAEHDVPVGAVAVREAPVGQVPLRELAVRELAVRELAKPVSFRPPGVWR